MTDHDVATHFHGVVVTLEQTARSWPADAAHIDSGNVCVTMSVPVPPTRPSATFTVRGIDGGGRTRVFRGLTLDDAASRPPALLVFR
jgi:hypothetical protein